MIWQSWMKYTIKLHVLVKPTKCQINQAKWSLATLHISNISKWEETVLSTIFFHGFACGRNADVIFKKSLTVFLTIGNKDSF